MSLNPKSLSLCRFDAASVVQSNVSLSIRLLVNTFWLTCPLLQSIALSDHDLDETADIICKSRDPIN